MLRPLTILYAGPALGGRTDSLLHLAGHRRASGSWDVHRAAADGFDWTWRAEVRRVCAAVLHTGAAWYWPIRSALEAAHAPHREAAARVFSLLPNVDGMVFVVDSRDFRSEANTATLATWLDELVRARGSVERFPVVFQLNHRDNVSARSADDLRHELRTPRCDYVESVASRGFGVDEALARLVAMIDGVDDDGASHSERAPRTWRRPPVDPPPSPAELAALFQSSERDVLPDGSCREVFDVVAPFTLTLKSGQFILAERYEAPFLERTVPPGRYPVVLLRRTMEYRRSEGGVERQGPVTLAARVALSAEAAASVSRVDAGTKRQEGRFVFGDPVRGWQDAVLATRATYYPDLAAKYRTGLFTFRVVDVRPALRVGSRRIPLPVPKVSRMEHADEGPVAMFDANAWNEPVRAYWEKGADGTLTAFTIFGEPGADVLGQRLSV